MTRALFAPDWRDGVPYQKLLGDALSEEGVSVNFLAGYRRVFPLWRALKNQRQDVFHLHWPEAYYPRMSDGWDWFRQGRFPLDLALATRCLPLVLTAHNLHTHNRPDERLEKWNTRSAMRRAAAVIAHSDAAKTRILEAFGISPECCHVIPHGDLSVSLGTPIARETARQELGLTGGRQCLIFGAVEPYKGIEEIIEFWRDTKPDAKLAIVGKPISPAYSRHIEQLAADVPNTSLHLRRMSDDELRLWLSATDAVIFNYRTIFTSGAACLTRSWGVPLLIPWRLATVDLSEPHPLVFRFDKENFALQLQAALDTPPDFEAAREWRTLTNWNHIAQKTAAVYRRVLAAVA